MSNARYLTKLRATMKTQAPRSNGRNKFWSRMFLATAFLAATPLQISAVHSSVRPAQTLWDIETSNLALGIFAERATKLEKTKLVQVATSNYEHEYEHEDDPKPDPGPKPTPRSNPCDGADNCGSERRTKNVKPVVKDNIVSVHG
jgi:hypothetical protein